MIDVPTFLISVGIYFLLGIALGTQWQYEAGFKAGWNACDKFWGTEALKGTLDALQPDERQLDLPYDKTDSHNNR